MTGSRIPGAWTRASLRARVLLLAVALLTVGFTAFSLVTGNALRGYWRTASTLNCAPPPRCSP